MRALRALLHIALLAALVGCGSGGGGVDVDFEDAMPQETGDRWAYRDASGVVRVDRVTSHTAMGGIDAAVVAIDQNGYQWTEYRHVSADKVVLFGYDEDGSTYRAQPPAEFPGTATVGTTYRANGRMLEDGVDRGACGTTLKVERIEDVTVAAGTFTNCLVVRAESFDPWDDWSNRVWYAPGVGVVKLEGITNTRRVELTGAHVGGLDYGTPPPP